LIDVVLLKEAFLPRLAVELVAFMSGKHARHPNIHFGRAREVRIDTPAGAAPVAIVADGAEVGQTPAAVTLRPASLTVRVPRAGRPCASFRPTGASPAPVGRDRRSPPQCFLATRVSTP